MLRSGYLFSLLCLSFSVWAQIPVVNKGKDSDITILGGTLVFINGSYTHVDAKAKVGPIANFGTLELTGNLVNHTKTSLFDPSGKGKVVFSGDSNQHIQGDTIIDFSNLEVRNKDSSLVLEVGILVNDSLIVSKGINYGNIWLHGHDIDLGQFGHLWGELPKSHIFGTEGYVKGDTRFVKDSSFENNLAGVGLGIGTNTSRLPRQLGITSFKRGHSHQAGVTGKGSIGRYYKLTTDTTVKLWATLQLHYLDSVETRGFDEAKFSLWKSTNGGNVWNRAALSTPDSGGNYVSADSVYLGDGAMIVTVGETNCLRVPLVHLGKDTLFMCPHDTITLDASNPGLYYKWSTKATSQTIQIIEKKLRGDSLFFVKVTNANGCVGLDTVSIIKKGTPIAKLQRKTLGGTCLKQHSLFQVADSLQTKGLRFHWDFGVANSKTDTSNLSSASFIYPEYGKYQVHFSAVSMFGCHFDTSFQYPIHPLPTAIFQTSDVCVGSQSDFVNESVLNTPANSGYALHTSNWDFGRTDINGDTATYPAVPTKSPTYLYPKQGTFNVRLIMETNAGCRDTVIHPSQVFPVPKANFTFQTEVCNEADIFLRNFTPDSLLANSYKWQFGDGFTSNLRQPGKSYASGGKYSIQLKVTTPHACADSSFQEVRIAAFPHVAFSSNNACATDSVLLRNTSSQGTSKWTFQGMGVDTLRSPVLIYKAPGTYAIQLRMSTGANCSDSITKKIQVFPLPKAGFTHSGNLCTGASLVFQNNSIGATTYRWDFGEGSASNQTSPAHSYATEGSEMVTLYAFTDKSCKDTASQEIKVNPLPTISINETISTCGSSYLLQLNDTLGLKSIQWQGSVPDTMWATKNGIYHVNVMSKSNCSAQKDVRLTLKSIFKPNLGADTSICDSMVMRANYPGSVQTWYDNSLLAGTGSTLKVKSSGTYLLQITDQNNCTGADTVAITVHQSPKVDLGSDLAFCTGISKTISAGSDTNTYVWSPRGETTSSITLSQTGNYRVVATSPGHCRKSDEVKVTVFPLPYVSLGNDTSVCGPIRLDARNQGASFLWSTSAITPTITTSTAGKYRVTVTDSKGCQGSDSIHILSSPKPMVSLGSEKTLCNGGTLVLDAGNQGASFLWNDGSRGQTLLVASSGTYRVTVTNSQKCDSTNEVQVMVTPRVQVNLGNDTVICSNNSLRLNAGNVGDRYQWGSNNGFSSQNQNVSVQDSGTYWVQVKTLGNCTGTDTLHVSKSKDAVFAEFLAISLLDVGDTVQFINLSSQNKVSYAWNFGDGSSSTTEDPKHIYFLANTSGYEVSLTIKNSFCSNTITKTIIVNPLKEIPSSGASQEIYNDFVLAKLFPNPAESSTQIELELLQQATISIFLYDSKGTLLATIEREGASLVEMLDLQAFASGAYFVKINIGQKEKILRLLKW